MRHTLAGRPSQGEPVGGSPARYVTDPNASDLIEISGNKQPASGVKHHFVNARAGPRAKALHPIAQGCPVDTAPFRNSVGCNTVDLGEITTDVQAGAVRKQIAHGSVGPGSDCGPGASIPLCEVGDREVGVSETAASIKITAMSRQGQN